MALPAPGPQDPAGARQPPPAASPTPSDRTPDAALLEWVLRQTSEWYHSSEQFDAADMEALLEVGRRHRGEPLSLEPVAVELVQAALRGHFSPQADTAEVRRTICTQIAQTLLDDPVARERLQTFWAQLVRGQP
jgi:hypothetical protein